MGKAAKQEKNKALRIGSVVRSLGKMKIRRASDDETIIINTQQDKCWKTKIEEFCKGTDGFISGIG